MTISVLSFLLQVYIIYILSILCYHLIGEGNNAKQDLHWTSRSSETLRGLCNAGCVATQEMRALWCAFCRCSRCSSERRSPVLVTLGSSALPSSRETCHASVGAGTPPSDTHATVSEAPSKTGRNTFPGSRRRQSTSK